MVGRSKVSPSIEKSRKCRDVSADLNRRNTNWSDVRKVFRRETKTFRSVESFEFINYFLGFRRLLCALALHGHHQSRTGGWTFAERVFVLRLLRIRFLF